MAKAQTQFPTMDFSKLMNFDVAKAMKDMKVPGLNMDQLMSIQRRNLEAMTEANQLAAEGLQALTRRQAEIVRETMDEFTAALKEIMATGTPEANASRQGELAKHVFEKSLSNLRELAELMAKSNTEAFEVIKKRMVEGLDEIKSLGQSAAQKK